MELDSWCCSPEMYSWFLHNSHVEYHSHPSFELINCYWIPHWPITRGPLLRGWKLNNLTSVIHYSWGISSSYLIFFLSSCCLFIVIITEGAVLFIIRLTWLCYLLFLIFQTQIFIIHVIFNPIIHYSLFSFHPQLFCWAYKLVCSTIRSNSFGKI